MYPTSRTSFAAVLGIVGMFLLTLSTAFGWNPEIINGVQYIPMSEVRTHYKLTRERTEGRQKVYEVPEKIQIRIQARSQDMFMNNMKFVLSYPVADHPSKGLMVSNMDLHKIIDPVLRPTYIANRRSFNTVVIDPGHGGHDSGTRNRISREADINLSVGKKLRDRLKTMGYQVVMTRDTDNFIALQDRVRIANRHNNAISISPRGGNLHAGACRHFLLHVPQYPPRRSAGQRPGQHEHCLGYSRPGAHAERAACHQGGHFHG